MKWRKQPFLHSAQVKYKMLSALYQTSSGDGYNDAKIEIPAWYTDDDLSRSDVPNSTDVQVLKNAQFLLVQEGEKGTDHWFLHNGTSEQVEEANPLFLSHDEMSVALGDEHAVSAIAPNDRFITVWIGEKNAVNYFAVYLYNRDESSVEPSLPEMDQTSIPKRAQLREFGDRITSQSDAAIYSTANGLIEFHRSHQYCSYCGSATISRKAGSSRICSKHRSNGGSCKSPSIYPRIDVASIMLVTSPCDNYALLGRKSMWPKGRYSTLAGFLEVGETIEQCCVRETFEESGIKVDRNSVEFVKSQPWPFPRSLMVGFRARAKSSGGVDVDANADADADVLPKINIDENEMEDIQWFHREFVAQRLEGGSTALMYNPTEKEQEFHVPGKASLARLLITQWALEQY
jgi:NADH pyrophosphatase NudC (nudix superfamily)